MSKIAALHNYCVYFLTNKNKTVLYIGVTNNLKDRLFYHLNPEANSKSFSHKYKCRYLIYIEYFQNVKDAIKREKQLKNGIDLKKNS